MLQDGSQSFDEANLDESEFWDQIFHEVPPKNFKDDIAKKNNRLMTSESK